MIEKIRVFLEKNDSILRIVNIIICIIIMAFAICGCSSSKTYYHAEATQKVDIYTQLPSFKEIVKDELKPEFYTCGNETCINKDNAIKLFILMKKIHKAYNYALAVYDTDIKAYQKIVNPS